eukprot:jgi/Tetstr1/453241/TSEL_040257.t1
MTAERPRRGSASASPWAALPAGVKEGLARLVADNRDSVAAMLQAGQEETEQQLCGRCAGVIKQQQLSPGSFLARFFPAEILSAHAELMGKSGKGGAATLADRIHACWAKGPTFTAAQDNREIAAATQTQPDPAVQKPAKKVKVADGSSAKGMLAAGPTDRLNPERCFVLDMKLAGELGDKTVLEAFSNALLLANRAWELCEDLEMPSGDWDTVTEYRGQEVESSCYDLMVTKAGDNWEPEDMFKKFVMKNVRKRTVKLTEGRSNSAVVMYCGKAHASAVLRD